MSHEHASPEPETVAEEQTGGGRRPSSCCVSSEDALPLPRRRSKSVMGLLAMTSMLAACGMYGMGGGRSSYAERHDPDRQKTPEDLERMAAAQRKRERKAARRNSPHNSFYS